MQQIFHVCREAHTSCLLQFTHMGSTHTAQSFYWLSPPLCAASKPHVCISKLLYNSQSNCSKVSVVFTLLKDLWLPLPLLQSPDEPVSFHPQPSRLLCLGRAAFSFNGCFNDSSCGEDGQLGVISACTAFDIQTLWYVYLPETSFSLSNPCLIYYFLLKAQLLS